MKLTFIETRPFRARWQKRAGDEALRAMQNELLESPDRGSPMPGCGILRKLRFGDPSRGEGKRGGMRVIYMLTPEACCVHLIAVFGKDEKSDVSKSEMKELCSLARLLREEVLRSEVIGPGRKGPRK